MQIFKEFEQGSGEWMNARLGIVTASEMHNVLRKGEMRHSYMCKLIGEIITQEPADCFSTAATERGHDIEPVARLLYMERTGYEVEEVGFIRNFDDIGGVGYSPDGLIGEVGLLEIKTKKPYLQVKALLGGELGMEHYAQMQCGLWVTNRRWCDYVSHFPGMPSFYVRVSRDEAFIADMKAKTILFYEELQTHLQTIRKAA